MRALLIASVVVVAFVPRALAQDPTGHYSDNATSGWFKSLASKATRNCCDQADCHVAQSDFHDNAWYALSNRTDTWVKIDPSQLTYDARGNPVVSIFKDSILCEGDPYSYPGDAAYAPRVYCFAPPPLGF